jgi:protein-S-isoprenylcysteine O-methyltransferase Ste14
MKTNVDSANIRFPPPLIYLVGLLLGILGGRVLGLASIGFGASIGTALAGTFLLLGLVVNLAGAGRFLHLGTAIIPHKAASKLVTSGIYRWTRNPMYLGMALLYAGIAILFDSIGALLLLPIVLAVIQTQVIAREEAYLERAFGDEYLAYKRRVRRWI